MKNTIEYLNSIKDFEFKKKESKRLFIEEPLKAFINSVPSSYREKEFVKLYFTTIILNNFRVLKLSDNKELFDGKTDFLYDKLTGYAIFDIGGRHASLMRIIWAIRNIDQLKDINFKGIQNPRHARRIAHTEIPDYYSEYYLTSGYGFYMSSVMVSRHLKVLTLSEKYKFSAQEKIIFKNFKKGYI